MNPPPRPPPPVGITSQANFGQGSGNVTLLLDPSLCTLQTCDLTMSSFRYLTSLESNTFFATLFGVLLVVQLSEGVKYKTTGYMSMIGIGAFLEMLGYIFRVKMHYAPFNPYDFVGNIYPLSMGPTFLTAGIYMCLGRIINCYGVKVRYTPKIYMLFFAGVDQISLALQGIGGTMASYVKIYNSATLLVPAKNVMIVGLVFQVITMTIFAYLSYDLWDGISAQRAQWKPKYFKLVTSLRFKLFLLSLSVATLTIYIRSVFRVAELWGGFRSKLFTTDEPTFLVLEGGMITVAVGVLTLLHPGHVFGHAWHETSFPLWGPEKVMNYDMEPTKEDNIHKHIRNISGPTDLSSLYGKPAQTTTQPADYNDMEKGVGYYDQKITRTSKRHTTESKYPSPPNSMSYSPKGENQFIDNPFADPARASMGSNPEEGTRFRVTFSMHSTMSQIPRVTRVDEGSYSVSVMGNLNVHDVE